MRTTDAINHAYTHQSDIASIKMFVNVEAKY